MKKSDVRQTYTQGLGPERQNIGCAHKTVGNK